MKAVIKTDFSRSLCSWKFPCSVFLMFLVWELNSKRFVLVEDVLYLFIHTWGRSITSLLVLVVSALVYTGSYCEDAEHHFIRYQLLRTSLPHYVSSKILACFFSTFLVLFCGTLFFILHQVQYLPPALEGGNTVENFQAFTCFPELLCNHPLIFMILQTALYGLLCGSMSVLTLALSTFIKNSYGVFAIPFLLHHFFYHLFSGFAIHYPIFHMFKIYDAAACYTKNPVFFLSYAVFITLLFILTAYGIMYEKLKGEFQ